MVMQVHRLHASLNIKQGDGVLCGQHVPASLRIWLAQLVAGVPFAAALLLDGYLHILCFSLMLDCLWNDLLVRLVNILLV